MLTPSFAMLITCVDSIPFGYTLAWDTDSVHILNETKAVRPSRAVLHALTRIVGCEPRPQSRGGAFGQQQRSTPNSHTPKDWRTAVNIYSNNCTAIQANSIIVRLYCINKLWSKQRHCRTDYLHSSEASIPTQATQSRVSCNTIAL